MTEKTYYTPLDFGFWTRYWETMRPYVLYVSAFTGLAGISLVSDYSPGIVILSTIACFFIYGLANGVVDVFHIKCDEISAPERPLVKGEIGKVPVLLVSMLGICLAFIFAVSVNSHTIVPSIFAFIALLLYTPLKRTWWGGPPWNAIIVAILPFLGFIMISPEQDSLRETLAAIENPNLLFTLLAVAFAYANFVLMGYLKDIRADAETGFNTFAVKFGWQPTIIYSHILCALSAFSTFMAIYPELDSLAGTLGVIVLIVAVIVNMIGQIGVHSVREEAKVHKPLSFVLRALAFYCLAIILTYKLEWLPFVLLLYAGFEFTLRNRPDESQL